MVTTPWVSTVAVAVAVTSIRTITSIPVTSFSLSKKVSILLNITFIHHVIIKLALTILVL